MIWSVFVTFAIMCVGFGQVVQHACSQLGHLVLQHLTALDNQNSFNLLLCAHSCLRCLSSSRSSLRSGPRKCMARTDSKKTLGKRCDVAGQVIVDKFATTFVPCDVELCEVTRTVCND